VLLRVENLRASLVGSEKLILKGVNLEMGFGEVHVLMGPNGSGKSTLANVIVGNPKFKVVSGDILFEGESILNAKPHERVAKGIFMTFQSPVEVDGVRLKQLLLTSYRKIHGDDSSFYQLEREMKRLAEELGLRPEFFDRFVNVGFSGGERKKSEILQASFLKPKLLILDEIDSGLDVDALKLVLKMVNALREQGTSLLIITHYTRILEHLDVNKVHVYLDGKIVASGDKWLAYEVEKSGYALVGER